MLLFIEKPTNGAFGCLFELLGHDLNFFHMFVGCHKVIEVDAVFLHYSPEVLVVDTGGRHSLGVGMAERHQMTATLDHKAFVDIARG